MNQIEYENQKKTGVLLVFSLSLYINNFVSKNNLNFENNKLIIYVI
jgi:hypothetical protein